MFWQIASYPFCEFHVFLSHCAEDRDWLILPVYDALAQRGIIPWLDREDYYYGRDSRSALRDGLLRSRHVVFFITQAMLDNSRGWCALELAYSDLLQRNLMRPGGNLLNFELPLMFLDRMTPGPLPRTAWSALQDRGTFHDPSDGSPVAWAVEQISEFLRREQELALNMATLAANEPTFDAELKERHGRFERVTRFDPVAIA